MNQNLILQPLFAMFLLVTLVVSTLARRRFTFVKQKTIKQDYYKTFQGNAEPDNIVVCSRNLANLFEMPVLFYVVVFMIYLTNHVDATALLFAWLFVAFRAAHSFVHLTSNHVMTRFRLYLLANTSLLVLWARLFVQMYK